MGSRLRRAVSLGSLNQDLMGMALSKSSGNAHEKKQWIQEGQGVFSFVWE